jgi:hypothetical protein
VMNPILQVFIPVGLFCIFLVVTSYFANSKKKKQKKREREYSSFSVRHQKMLDEVRARKSEEEQYRERIEAAFDEARKYGALLVSEVPYHDIETDMFRNRGRNPRDLPKPLLTRISPVMTKELAEQVREYEVLAENDFSGLDERISRIGIEARSIHWRIEEVPEHYEPPNLKDEDRISYPEAYSGFLIPAEIRKAAREMLGYDDAYVRDAAELQAAKSDSFEVTEE